MECVALQIETNSWGSNTFHRSREKCKSEQVQVPISWVTQVTPGTTKPGRPPFSDSFPHPLCSPAGPPVTATTGTDNLQATTLGSCIHNGGPEHGPFRFNVPNHHWYVRKTLLEVWVKDPTNRGFPQPFQVHHHYSFGSVRQSPPNGSNSLPSGDQLTALPLSSIQFNSIQFYLYSAKLQQLSSQGT